jgi:recombination protein RecA
MKTDITALDKMMQTIEKKVGKEIFSRSWGDIKGVPTGSVMLDNALGIGGIPEGKVTEIFGWESSGKTSLALSIIATRQKWRKEQGIEDQRDLIVDLEHSMTESFIKGFGIDLDQIIWVRCDTAEEALQVIVDLPKTGCIDICLFDSIDAAQNERQLKRSVGEVDMGGISKELSFTLRQITKYDHTTFIFINQIRQTPGKIGNPNTTPGGNAMKFYALLRLEVMRRQPSDIPGTFLMRIKLVKTKIAMPIHEKDPLSLFFKFGEGFNPYADLIIWAKQLKILAFQGRALRVKWTDEEEPVSLDNPYDFYGGPAMEQLLKDDNELYERLMDRCQELQNKEQIE